MKHTNVYRVLDELIAMNLCAWLSDVFTAPCDSQHKFIYEKDEKVPYDAWDIYSTFPLNISETINIDALCSGFVSGFYIGFDLVLHHETKKQS